MPFPEKPLHDVQEGDLLTLKGAEPERKTLEYKRDAIGKSDADRREFLYDVSSFANALGGHIVLGMAEDKGVPTELLGLAGIDPDAEILRLEQMARTGIRPPIIGLETVPVALANGNTAIVMSIPRSGFRLV
jgi:hypothetical protein